MNAAGQSAIGILLVEGPLLTGAARAAPHPAATGRLRFTRARGLDAAIDAAASGEYAVLLLDLDTVDDAAIERVAALCDAAPGAAVLVRSDRADPESAAVLVRAGADDVLPRAASDAETLERAILCAIERQRASRRAWRGRLRRRQRREISLLERLTGTGPALVTAQMFGIQPLKVGYPEVFAALTEEYRELLDDSLEERVYRIDNGVRERLRAAAQQLGVLHAGPRDIVEIHTEVLQRMVREVSQARSHTLMEESRLLALELMGYLVSYYRNRTVAVPDARLRRVVERRASLRGRPDEAS